MIRVNCREIFKKTVKDAWIGNAKGGRPNDIAGLTHKSPSDHSFSAYRFHEEYPVLFQKSLWLTCRCGEKTKRETWEAPPSTYTTYVWIYEW